MYPFTLKLSFGWSFQGLRITALVGAMGTCIGAWIKVFSVQPDLFFVSFAGQSIVALSQVNNSFTDFYFPNCLYCLYLHLNYAEIIKQKFMKKRLKAIEGVFLHNHVNHDLNFTVKTRSKPRTFSRIWLIVNKSNYKNLLKRNIKKVQIS